MAYISADDVKKYRAMIKTEFPVKDGWKFSVSQSHHSTLNIRLMQYPDGYSFPAQSDLNHYHLDNAIEQLDLGKREAQTVRKMLEIANHGHWDKSDIMTDYFNCAYYINLEIGKWDKCAVSTSEAKAARAQNRSA